MCHPQRPTRTGEWGAVQRTCWGSGRHGSHGRGRGRFLLGHVCCTPPPHWLMSRVPGRELLVTQVRCPVSFRRTLRVGDTAGVTLGCLRQQRSLLLWILPWSASPRRSGVPQGSHPRTRPGAHRGLDTARVGHTPRSHSQRPSCLLLSFYSFVFSTAPLSSNGRSDTCSAGRGRGLSQVT